MNWIEIGSWLYNITISIVAVTDAFTVYKERKVSFGFDVLINCSVEFIIEQNNTILWAQFYPFNMLISETLKYTLNDSELIIHNVTVEDEGKYACYSEEIAIVYTVTHIRCKYFLGNLFTI